MSKPNIVIQDFAHPQNLEYTVTLNTDKDRIKFIKRIETHIRSSLEYKDYIAFLKENMDMNKCAFFDNIRNEQGSRIRIEVHHEPLTLFDIVETVINKYLDEAIPLNDLYIADEVMELHYKNQVGLIPLSKSVHQIIHNSNEIIIPLTMVYGDYKSFLETYNDYLSEDLVNKIEMKINQTKTIRAEMFDKLKPTFTYVNVDGFNLPQKIEKSAIA